MLYGISFDLVKRPLLYVVTKIEFSPSLSQIFAYAEIAVLMSVFFYKRIVLFVICTSLILVVKSGIYMLKGVGKGAFFLKF